MTLVLVGMSASDVHRQDQLLDAAHRHGATLAFLQLADPSLTSELTRLADAGAISITLLGVDTGPLAPGQSWLRRIAAHWWRERAGHRPEIHVADVLVADLADLEVGGTRPITGSEPGLTSAAWEEVSRHRHQVLVCRGPRCTASGAEDTLRALVLAAVQHQLGDDDLLLVHTGCQSPCNRAPVLNVQPDDVWYGHVDPSAAAEIVSRHLVDGHPVQSRRLARSKGSETC